MKLLFVQKIFKIIMILLNITKHYLKGFKIKFIKVKITFLEKLAFIYVKKIILYYLLILTTLIRIY